MNCISSSPVGSSNHCDIVSDPLLYESIFINLEDISNMADENEIRRMLGLPPLSEKKSGTNSNTESFKDLSVLIKKIMKAVNTNKIPKTHAEVMAMKERLELEEKQLEEKNEAVKVIKDIQAKRKQRESDKKKARRAKIKKFFRK